MVWSGLCGGRVPISIEDTKRSLDEAIFNLQQTAGDYGCGVCLGLPSVGSLGRGAKKVRSTGISPRRAYSANEEEQRNGCSSCTVYTWLKRDRMRMRKRIRKRKNRRTACPYLSPGIIGSFLSQTSSVQSFSFSVHGAYCTPLIRRTALYCNHSCRLGIVSQTRTRGILGSAAHQSGEWIGNVDLLSLAACCCCQPQYRNNSISIAPAVVWTILSPPSIPTAIKITRASASLLTSSQYQLPSQTKQPYPSIRLFADHLPSHHAQLAISTSYCHLTYLRFLYALLFILPSTPPYATPFLLFLIPYRHSSARNLADSYAVIQQGNKHPIIDHGSYHQYHLFHRFGFGWNDGVGRHPQTPGQLLGR